MSDQEAIDDGTTYDDPELAAQQAALAEQIAAIAAARAEVQSQTHGLEGDVGSFRAEQQLAADAARTVTAELATSQGGDFYSPDVGQTIAPDGTVTYDFDAHLLARGVDITAGLSFDPPTDRRVRWLRATDGALVADIYGTDDGSGHREGVFMARGRTAIAADAEIVARNEDNTAETAVFRTWAGGGMVPRAETLAGATAQATVLDANDQSAFLRWITPSGQRIDAGSIVVTWDGVAKGVLATTSHRLGVVGTVVLLGVSFDTSNGGGYVVNHYSRTATQITVHVMQPAGSTYVPPAGARTTVWWMLIS
jgi:hypothetical protein